jgi:rhodanese-related sulfurtransferase
MIAQVRPSDLTRWLADAGPQAVVLDVREPHELQIANLSASGLPLRAIPMGAVPIRLAELDPGQPVACLCHHGGRSMQVAHFLVSRGFSQVANIAGGINAWSAEVDPGVPRY